MRLFAFWALRGYKLSDLAALTESEKMFLSATCEIYNEELTGKLK